MINGKVLVVGCSGIIIPRSFKDFGDVDCLKFPPVEGAFEALAKLVTMFQAENVYLVSKGGQKRESRRIAWLAQHDFFKITGIPALNTFFYLSREKRGLMYKTLAPTHCVVRCLGALQGNDGPRHVYLFKPKQRAISARNKFPDKVSVVGSWEGVMKNIEATFII